MACAHTNFDHSGLLQDQKYELFHKSRSNSIFPNDSRILCRWLVLGLWRPLGQISHIFASYLTELRVRTFADSVWHMRKVQEIDHVYALGVSDRWPIFYALWPRLFDSWRRGLAQTFRSYDLLNYLLQYLPTLATVDHRYWRRAHGKGFLNCSRSLYIAWKWEHFVQSWRRYHST